jgi:hypothetical protein
VPSLLPETNRLKTSLPAAVEVSIGSQRAERDPALAERGDGVEQVAGRAAEP